MDAEGEDDGDSIFSALDSMINDFTQTETDSAFSSQTDNNLDKKMLTEEDCDEDSKDTLHICDKCSFQTEDLERFIDHVSKRMVHELVCLICSRKFIQKSHLKKHYKKEHKKEKKINCNSCLFKAISQEELQTHKFKLHISNIYSCITCDLKCEKSEYFVKHLHSHKSLEGIRTAQKISKKENNDTLLEGGLLKCKDCDYEAERNVNMKRHKIKHHSDKFKCKECEYNGTHQKDLMRHHLKIHSKENKRLVPISKSTMEKMTKRSRSVAYACDLCFTVLASEITLTQHKRIKHP